MAEVQEPDVPPTPRPGAPAIHPRPQPRPAEELTESVESSWSPADQGSGSGKAASASGDTPFIDVTALDLGGDVVFITDADGNIVDVNDAFVRVTGYSKREAIGSKPSLLSSGFQDESFYQQLWDTISSGQVWEGQLVDRRRDGALRTHHATISPVQDESGRITHYVAFERDVTTELGRHGAVGSTGLLHTDLAGRCVYADARAASLIGRPSTELLGPGLLSALEESDAAELREVIGMAAELGREHRLDARTVHGSWLHLEVAPLSVASGAVIGAVCGVEDVSEQLSVHRELARRDAFVASVLDALPDAVAIIDPDGSVAAVNHAWLTASGRAKEDRVLATRVGEDIRATIRTAIDDGDEDARVLAEDLHRVLKGMTSAPQRGSRFQVTPLRTDDGGAVLRKLRG
ncbi:MAG: PAS domain-containing protein [Nitriliruptoraceae bacterium]